MQALLINGKPLAELTEDEMRQWCEQLRDKREALRAEAIAKKKAAETAKVEPKPKAPRQPKKVDDFTKNMLDFLMEDD